MAFYIEQRHNNLQQKALSLITNDPKCIVLHLINTKIDYQNLKISEDLRQVKTLHLYRNTNLLTTESFQTKI